MASTGPTGVLLASTLSHSCRPRRTPGRISPGLFLPIACLPQLPVAQALTSSPCSLGAYVPSSDHLCTAGLLFSADSLSPTAIHPSIHLPLRLTTGRLQNLLQTNAPPSASGPPARSSPSSQFDSYLTGLFRLCYSSERLYPTTSCPRTELASPLQRRSIGDPSLICIPPFIGSSASQQPCAAAGTA